MCKSFSRVVFKTYGLLNYFYTPVLLLNHQEIMPCIGHTESVIRLVCLAEIYWMLASTYRNLIGNYRSIAKQEHIHLYYCFIKSIYFWVFLHRWWNMAKCTSMANDIERLKVCLNIKTFIGHCLTWFDLLVENQSQYHLFNRKYICDYLTFHKNGNNISW